MLSHALLVEAIESEFVPFLVVNNRAGQDKEWLERFGEPAWNYQVVRFLDEGGEDNIPRRDKVWNVSGIAARMVLTLEKSGRPVPKYLRSLSPPKGQVGVAAFAMYCFWTGEVELGKLDGVLKTEAGWLDGREVTKVWFDRGVLSFTDLLKSAERVDCARAVYTETQKDRDSAKQRAKLHIGSLGGYKAAKASDEKRQLLQTPVASLPMSSVQATKLNALYRSQRKEAMEWLSPRQLELLRQ